METEPPFIVAGDSRVVQLWSQTRLPFEPKGWLVDMREELRAALLRMTPIADHVLHATYAAADTGQFCDVENVLLYNVGSRSLRAVSRTGVRFERSFTAPRSLGERRYAHHHKYELSPQDSSFAWWREVSTLFAFSDVGLDRIDKPGPVWAAVRSHSPPPRFTTRHVGRFAVRVTMRPPSSSPDRSVIDAIKPVLDGLISALHSHVGGGDLDTVADRLAVAGVATRATVADMLLDPAWAVLGPRRLIKPFGDVGVQWNPADDLCVAAQVTVGEPRHASDEWSMTGVVSRIEPAHVGRRA